MIIFLYGPDTYRSRQKLNEIIEYYKKIHKSGLNLKFFREEKMDFQNFLDEMKQAPMFKEKKLAVLFDVFSNPEFKKGFLEKGRDLLKSGNIFLIYEINQISEKDPLFLFLKKFAKVQEFKLLEAEKLKNWVKKRFLNYKMEIENHALEKLINFVGNDLWQMENEIKKLVSYKLKSKSGISAKDIELLIKPKIETDIFKTIEAMGQRNKKKALKFIKAHLEKGDSPIYLFSMIHFQFRNLLIIKDLMEKNLSPYGSNYLHPYVIKKTIPLLEKFSFLELKKIYQRIFQLDLDIKTGKIEPEIALDLLIAEI
jgi:DNA polymerase-3 subunit delta